MSAVPMEPEEGIRSLEAGVAGSCESPDKAQRSSPDLLQERAEAPLKRNCISAALGAISKAYFVCI